MGPVRVPELLTTKGLKTMYETVESLPELSLYAVLDSPSLAGAFAFRIVPGQETITDITARLFFRSDVERIGIALITSMFLFGESNRYVFDDYRSQVDDSDGLQITSSEGTQIWRTPSNPLALANSRMP